MHYEGADDDIEGLVRACPVAMAVASAGGEILFANDAALKLTGYDVTELSRRYMFELVAPEDLDDRPLDPGRIASGLPVDNERTLIRADGSRVWVRSTTQRMKNGHILFWLRDMTEQRRLEAQLLEAQKLETVGLLAAGLAHDLNNLLTIVTGHAELLRLGPDEKAIRDSAECIGTASDRAAELTKKLLAFGRKQVLRPRALDLNELLQKNLPLIRSMCGERIEVRVDLDANLDLVEADPLHLEQALWNLVTNACQAMERGGRLTVRTANVELDGQARDTLSRPRPDPRFVAMSVEDTGPGMREDTLRRVFDPFFTTKRSGSGLGLSVVHGVVGQSGGLVRVRSTLGAGSCFEICLPRCERQRPDSVRPKASSTRASPTGGTLLLVEDERAVRAWLEQALTRRGFSVHAASDGEDALAVAEGLAEPPLALITDVSMPRLNGPELVARLRKRWPLVPVLFITAYAHDDAFRSLPAGSDLLVKPFTAAALVERLHDLCGRA